MEGPPCDGEMDGGRVGFPGMGDAECKERLEGLRGTVGDAGERPCARAGDSARLELPV
jgi:hypothetical protein